MTTTWGAGELAGRAGVSVRALHHYDEIGLLTPERSAAGHRRYTPSDLARLTQIVALRSLGLSLGEIQHCLDSGEALAATLTRQLADLEARLEQTAALRDRLATVVARLDRGRDLDSRDLLTLIGDTTMLAEGKTKIIEDAGGGEVLVRSKDDLTAGDGARRDVLPGKAIASTRTTANVFELLERNGVRTHFVERVDDVTFRARHVDVLPLELVARRRATGSYTDRFPDVPEGSVFEEVVVELFEKDDARHDPLLDLDVDAGVVRRFVPNRVAAATLGPDAEPGDLLGEEPLAGSRFARVTPELLARLRSTTAAAFEVIEAAWAEQGGVYLDVKIECGFDRATGELLVADVIDSDSGRLRFGDVDVSKQAYRDGTATLPELRVRFDEVAARTDRFA